MSYLSLLFYAYGVFWGSLWHLIIVVQQINVEWSCNLACWCYDNFCLILSCVNEMELFSRLSNSCSLIMKWLPVVTKPLSIPLLSCLLISIFCCVKICFGEKCHVIFEIHAQQACVLCPWCWWLTYCLNITMYSFANRHLIGSSMFDIFEQAIRVFKVL